jgi:hypothetical protein
MTKYLNHYDASVLANNPALRARRNPLFFYAGSVPGPTRYGMNVAVYRVAKCDGGYRIAVGCRNFTDADALEHWTSVAKNLRIDQSRRRRAKAMIKLIPLIRRRARARGWI